MSSYILLFCWLASTTGTFVPEDTNVISGGSAAARLLRKEEPLDDPSSAATQKLGLPIDSRPDGIYPVLENKLQTAQAKELDRRDLQARRGAPVEVFDVLDRDQDGKISRQEFDAAEEELKKEEQLEHFQNMDAIVTPVVVEGRPVVEAVVIDDGAGGQPLDGGHWQIEELPRFQAQAAGSLVETSSSSATMVLEDELEKAERKAMDMDEEATVPAEISLDQIASSEDDDPDDLSENDEEDSEDRNRMQTEGLPEHEENIQTVAQISD